MFRLDAELCGLFKCARIIKGQASALPTEPQEVTFSGFCQDCGNYSDDLRDINGRWLCEECRS